MKHELKTWTPYFQEILDGWKKFELRSYLNRKDPSVIERDFNVGDTLWLREYSPTSDKYTDRECECDVIYILDDPDFGLQDGFCILGIDNVRVTA